MLQLVIKKTKQTIIQVILVSILTVLQMLYSLPGVDFSALWVYCINHFFAYFTVMEKAAN